MTTCTARYERDAEGNWLAELAEEPRVHTWARSLATTRAKIREAAELWFDIDELVVIDEYPTWVTSPLDLALPAREEAERVLEAAATATLEAVRELTDNGLSRRDVADLLGISFQRVQQLVDQAQRAAPA
ncbi:MAG: type II toxin-antitoxin system HicB family antitoxin [Acidimicrobiales bacterium]